MKIRTVIKAAGLGLAGLAITAGAAFAQASSRIDGSGDWSVFKTTTSEGAVCWVTSAPTEWVAKRAGKKVDVNRGDIYLMVSVWPDRGVSNEVSVVSGYPYAKDSKVKAAIGSDAFTMYTDGEGAWLGSPDDDGAMVKAMKKGRAATVVGESGRGTETTDTFSLMGFSAALTAAEKACG
jgi:hypothetical protein